MTTIENSSSRKTLQPIYPHTMAAFQIALALLVCACAVMADGHHGHGGYGHHGGHHGGHGHHGHHGHGGYGHHGHDGHGHGGYGHDGYGHGHHFGPFKYGYHTPAGDHVHVDVKGPHAEYYTYGFKAGGHGHGY